MDSSRIIRGRNVLKENKHDLEFFNLKWFLFSLTDFVLHFFWLYFLFSFV